MQVLDLTKEYPRSPKDTMCGLVHIPRMIDKARAFREHKLGEYIFPCPLDKLVLNFMRIDEIEFADKAYSLSETAFAQWLEENLAGKSAAEKEFINRQILGRKPDNEDRLKYFVDIRNRIDPSRTDIITWVGLLDLEEGH